VAVKMWIYLVLGSALLLSPFVLIAAFESPKDKFMNDCRDKYDIVDCYNRWQREHPMPDDYGVERK
jgi:hypothetical protein